MPEPKFRMSLLVANLDCVDAQKESDLIPFETLAGEEVFFVAADVTGILFAFSLTQE